jgi:CubicO group peptidase (beta-lactamase class C family)
MRNLYKMPILFCIALMASTLVASARPVLEIASMPDGNLSITTTVSAGETNSLQVASSLSTNTVWDTVGTVISGGLPLQAEWTVIPTNTMQLFRLVGSGCWLTGVVMDSTRPTGQPIPHATVTLIQTDGEATTMEATTDVQGRFILWLNEEVEIGSEYLAVSVRADNYRPREINVLATETNSIQLSLENTFQYYEPVQLDDGLQIGSLGDSNLDTNLIRQLMVKTVQSGYTELHSLLIYKDGHLVVEEYYEGNNDYIDFEGGILRKVGDPSQLQWGRTSRHYLASVNKSLTATVAGIAMDQFGYTPTNFIAPLLPDESAYFLADPNKAALTLHDMLTMQLGFVWDEWGSNDLTLLWQSTNFTDFVLSRNNKGPQSAWRYNSASPNMLLKGLEEMVPGTIRDWAHTNFYSKLGITDYDWQSQPDGLPEGAARMHMRPRDMMKVGVTYLNNGVWDDVQVIPTNWVEEVSTVQANGDYSYFFWIRQLNGVNYISADGDGGQYINIFPEENMVIVMTQGNYLGWPLYRNQANDMMGNFILPAVND